MAEHEKNEQKVSFKDTLNLPQTDFPIRANAKEDDPIMLKRWQEEQLDRKTFTHNTGKKKFILHDGPPYANGHIHSGHAFNKILKDITVKSQRMLGKHAPVTPGWDCHGLPIEHKVSGDFPNLDPVSLKKACRQYAQKWVDIQREEFKKLGVFMDWEHPYLTMNYSYEASIIRAFGKFVEGGYIERKNKTVPWCASCQTVLATAEIEYEDRKDPSIYVMFPLGTDAKRAISETLLHQEVSLLVWTTTPWTLPLNRAVLLKPSTPYVVLNIRGSLVVVGASRADALCAMMEVDKQLVAEFNSDIFVRKNSFDVYHPFISDLRVPLILDNSVLTDDGTACVHSAPGVGPEDYEVGVKNGLEIYSPVSPMGTYTADIIPAELADMKVVDGQIWVIKKLNEVGRLLHKTSLKHSYPHCWRCRNGLIFRATKQWFCDLERNDLKEKTVQAVNEIATYPEKSINRLKATIEGRLEWCLSRQRVWGVPIPALLCAQCDKVYITSDLINKVADFVEKQGIEAWDAVEIKDLIPLGTVCACSSVSFEKETDILDVWFDSGISHFAVLLESKELAFPADLYLEGKDQHRGWFQSSLLTSMVLEQTPAMKSILTHGFTVDEKGRKMSKSLGNVVSPDEMIVDLGTDGLRLWASSIDAAGEAVVSEKLLQNVKEVFRKIRNTARFLISNLYDFDIQKDAVPFADLRLIDRAALHDVVMINYEVMKAYTEFDYTAVYHTLGSYCSTQLSSYYLDIIKDRLYVEQADGLARRSAQTVCWYILDTLTRLIAPILSFTAEQLSDFYQKNKTNSIHLQDFASLYEVALFLQSFSDGNKRVIDTIVEHKGDLEKTVSALEKTMFMASKDDRWIKLEAVRSALLKGIEELRAQGIIKHSLEARVRFYVEPHSEVAQLIAQLSSDLAHTDQDLAAFLKEFVIVSQAVIEENVPGLTTTAVNGLMISIEPARGIKCPRCWNWDESSDRDGLCARCQGIVRR